MKHLRSGQPAAARPFLLKAVKADKRNGDIHGLLAGTDMMLGNIPDAVKGYSAALDLADNADAARDAARRVAYLLAAYTFDSAPVSAQTIDRCFQFRDLDHQTLLGPALNMVMTNGPWVRVLDRFEGEGAASAAFLLGKEGRGAVSHKLMRTCLTHGVLANREIELTLTALRRQCLEGNFYRSKELEGFLADLAVQCWFNEFVYFETGDETASVDELRAPIESGEGDIWALLTYGLYRPLSGVDIPDDLRGHKALSQLLEMTVDGPLEETRLVAEIDTLHDGVDAASEAVQQQYEENPYPRWISVTLPDDGERRATLARLTGGGSSWDRPLRVMIAGCGTGRQAAMAATNYGRDSRILAFDLSRRSLAHAVRNAEKFGLDNLSFAQGDILRLGETDIGEYDVIECIGVLHHLVDPMAGWRQLVDRLKPGGLMSIGLYRELGRDHCKAGRAEVAQLSLDGTLGGIRAYRKHVLARQSELHHQTLAGNRDFYSASGCRDLLFHVQERNYRLPEIAQNLEELGLKFLEFQVPGLLVKQFREAYPSPGADRDLANWDKFEQDNPSGFDAMYRFWCQKPTS